MVTRDTRIHGSMVDLVVGRSVHSGCVVSTQEIVEICSGCARQPDISLSRKKFARFKGGSIDSGELRRALCFYTMGGPDEKSVSPGHPVGLEHRLSVGLRL